MLYKRDGTDDVDLGYALRRVAGGIEVTNDGSADFVDVWVQEGIYTWIAARLKKGEKRVIEKTIFEIMTGNQQNTWDSATGGYQVFYRTFINRDRLMRLIANLPLEA